MYLQAHFHLVLEGMLEFISQIVLYWLMCCYSVIILVNLLWLHLLLKHLQVHFHLVLEGTRLISHIVWILFYLLLFYLVNDLLLQPKRRKKELQLRFHSVLEGKLRQKIHKSLEII